MENINPTLETIFQLLGQRTSKLKLTLEFKSLCGYPGEGLFLRPDDHYPAYGWCSLDLPNLIEKFRTTHTAHLKDTSEPLLEVIWTGKCPREVTGVVTMYAGQVSRTTIVDHLENIKNCGWDVELSPKEENGWEWGPHNMDTSEELHIPNFVKPF